MPQSSFYRRRFLNRPKFQTGAHVIAEVRREVSTFRGTESVNYDIALRIADCDRVISFDLSSYNAAERSNTLYKLDGLIDTLVAFRSAVACAFVEISAKEVEG